MPDTVKEADEKRFNETLKRMLKSPPQPHETVKHKTKPTVPPTQPLSKKE